MGTRLFDADEDKSELDRKIEDRGPGGDECTRALDRVAKRTTCTIVLERNLLVRRVAVRVAHLGEPRKRPGQTLRNR